MSIFKHPAQITSEGATAKYVFDVDLEHQIIADVSLFGNGITCQITVHGAVPTEVVDDLIDSIKKHK